MGEERDWNIYLEFSDISSPDGDPIVQLFLERILGRRRLDDCCIREIVMVELGKGGNVGWGSGGWHVDVRRACEWFLVKNVSDG